MTATSLAHSLALPAYDAIASVSILGGIFGIISLCCEFWSRRKTLNEMRLVFALVSIAILGISSIAHVAADVRYRGHAVHPDHPGQCYYEELDQAIPRGQTLKPINRAEHCESIYCRPDYVLEIQYCGRHQLMPNASCILDSDMRRPFPECCPKLLCQAESNDI